MTFVRWHSTSQALIAKHVPYPQLTATTGTIIDLVFIEQLHKILSENGKPLATSSEWNFHFQMQYPYSGCKTLSQTQMVSNRDVAH